MLPLLLACAGAPPVTTARTDGGSWDVTLQDTTVPMGRATVTLLVESTSTSPVEGLIIEATATMPGMGHEDAELVSEERDEGNYALTGWWSMRGRWTLEGTLADPERTESVVLELDVE